MGTKSTATAVQCGKSRATSRILICKVLGNNAHKRETHEPAAAPASKVYTALWFARGVREDLR